jgi:hypothetical protein
VKKQLLRPETFLLACPVMLLIFRQFFTPRMLPFVIYFHDTALVIPVSQLLLVILVVQLVYFFMHKLTRLTNKSSPVICKIHIITTQTCLAIVFLLYFVLEQYTWNRTGRSPSDTLEVVLFRGSFYPAFTWLETAFLCLHILFFLYCIVLLTATILTRLNRRKSF